MVAGARFITPEKECPYLPGRISKLEVRLVEALAREEEEAELAAGVRRFGRTLFQPACEGCRMCVPLRVPVRLFRPSKSQRRVLRRNADVSVDIGEPMITGERLDLFRRFHEARQRSRGWPESLMGPEEYAFTFLDNPGSTLEFRYRLGGRLIGIAYVGETRHALNSMYAFHAPDLARRSLGTLDVLVEIQEALSRGMDHLYLGYLVEGCTSMEYKSRFRPHEVLAGGSWRLSRHGASQTSTA